MHKKRKGLTMPSNNSKYSEEMRVKTVKFILESRRSATSVGEELGIDTNTICRWVRDYRRQNKLPSYAEEKGIFKRTHYRKDEKDIKIRDLEKELKRKEKLLDEANHKLTLFHSARKMCQVLKVNERGLLSMAQTGKAEKRSPFGREEEIQGLLLQETEHLVRRGPATTEFHCRHTESGVGK